MYFSNDLPFEYLNVTLQHYIPVMSRSNCFQVPLSDSNLIRFVKVCKLFNFNMMNTGT